MESDYQINTNEAFHPPPQLEEHAKNFGSQILSTAETFAIHRNKRFLAPKKDT